MWWEPVWRDLSWLMSNLGTVSSSPTLSSSVWSQCCTSSTTPSVWSVGPSKLILNARSTTGPVGTSTAFWVKMEPSSALLLEIQGCFSIAWTWIERSASPTHTCLESKLREALQGNEYAWSLDDLFPLYSVAGWSSHLFPYLAIAFKGNSFFSTTQNSSP